MAARMLWLNRNRLAGSYLPLTAAVGGRGPVAWPAELMTGSHACGRRYVLDEPSGNAIAS